MVQELGLDLFCAACLFFQEGLSSILSLIYFMEDILLCKLGYQKIFKNFKCLHPNFDDSKIRSHGENVVLTPHLILTGRIFKRPQIVLIRVDK